MAEQQYFPVSPLLITHGDAVSFNVYIKQKNTNRYLLFATSERLTDRHKNILMENDVKELYIPAEMAVQFEQYVMENYGKVLTNENIPIMERARIFHEHSTSLSRDAFENNHLYTVVSPEILTKIETIMSANYEFLAMNKDAFRCLSQLIDHNYKTYSHCLNTTIYTLIILMRINRFDAIEIDSGVGAFLHDIGKLHVPNEIIDKPARLTDKEFEIIKNHSALGYEVATTSNLSDVVKDCILSHHEKLDGSGYPNGLNDEDLPYQVQVLTIADIYDALTSNRAYCRAYTPFEALRIMSKDVERGKINREFYKLFLDFLSGQMLKV